MKFKLHDLRQRHLRDFMVSLKRNQPEEWDTMEELPILLYYDVFCQSAIDSDWFEELEPELDDLKYSEVVELATAVAELYTEATALDPN